MTEAEAFTSIKSWELEWKRTKDKARRSASNAANTGEGSIDSSTTFTGVCDLTLRTMSEVEQYPLCIGHFFPTKDHVLLRIAEEANLVGVRIKITDGRNNDAVNVDADQNTEKDTTPRSRRRFARRVPSNQEADPHCQGRGFSPSQYS